MKNLDQMLNVKPDGNIEISNRISGKVAEMKSLKSLYHYWGGKSGDHFYTINWAELENGRDGYVYERVVGYVLEK